MAETRSGGPMSDEEISRNYDRTRKVLADLIDSGFEPVDARTVASHML